MTVVRKILEGILTTGSTSISFTDALIPNSILKVTTTNSNVFPLSQTLSSNTLQLTFEAQTSNLGVSLEIIKQGLDIVDDLISSDADKALSAKQGKVLKDAIDAIVIPEVPDVINSLDSTSTTDALSAYQGKVLKDAIDAIVIPEVPDELNDLDDVVITSPTDGQALAYNSLTQKFTNQTIGGSGANYSLSETVVGSWLGNTLYQKTFHATNISINANGRTVIYSPTDISDLSIDAVVDSIGGFANFNSGANVINIPYAVGNTGGSISLYYDNTYGICLHRLGGAFVIDNLYLTIKYTKTT